MIRVGKTIQRLRSEVGLTQRELARAAEITPSFLSLIENDRRDPSLAVLRRIAGALSVPEEVIVWDAVEIPEKIKPIDKKLFEAAKLLVRKFYEAAPRT